MLATMVISVVDFANKKTTKNTFTEKFVSLKQNEVHLQAKVSRKTWEMMHIYSNVDVTWRISAPIKSVSYDGRWQILSKPISKVWEKTINKELNHCLNKSGVLYCMVHSLISRLGFNRLSSSKKIVSILLNLFQTFSWNTQQAIERQLS